MSIQLQSEGSISQTRVLLVKHLTDGELPDPQVHFRLDVASSVPREDTLQPNQVLIKNLFLSLDPTMRSWMSNSQSNYLPAPKLLSVMRGSSVGRVVYSTTPWLPAGTLVNCNPDAIGWQQYGVCHAHQVIPLPEHKSIPTTAWCGVLGGTGLTAYFGLLDVGKVCQGDTVLVSSAAGAVGSVVCQLAKRVFHCRVVGIAGSEEKCTWLKDVLGIDEAVDYRASNFAHALKQAMKSKPANVVFDNVGGKVLDEMLKHLQVGCRVVLCGAISGVKNNPITNHMNLIVRSSSMTGFLLFSYRERYSEAYAQLAQYLLEGKLLFMRETKVLGLENAPQALLQLFSGQNVGKLLVDLHPTVSQL